VANTRSAVKRTKQNERRRQRNRAARSKIRSVLKSASTALESQPAASSSAVRDALRTLDKAVTQGVLHRNTAARKKSALARSLRSVK
jgi:small subunit ribosomal protein S20